MESQNIEFRAVITFFSKEGANAKEIDQCMADVYGDSSPKYSTVAKWSGGCQKPEHARSLAKGGVESRTSGNVQSTIPIEKTPTCLVSDETWLHHSHPYTKKSPCN